MRCPNCLLGRYKNLDGPGRPRSSILAKANMSCILFPALPLGSMEHSVLVLQPATIQLELSFPPVPSHSFVRPIKVARLTPAHSSTPMGSVMYSGKTMATQVAIKCGCIYRRFPPTG